MKLSETPFIHPTASVTDSVLGRYTEVGAGCHVAHSTTGALCIAAATHIAGTVAAELAARQPQHANTVAIEHPSGRLAVHVHAEDGWRNVPRIARASVVLTARPLFDGFAFPNAYCS